MQHLLCDDVPTATNLQLGGCSTINRLMSAASAVSATALLVLVLLQLLLLLACVIYQPAPS